MLQKHRLLTPGPTPIPDRVRLVMAQAMIHHRKPEFKAVMQRIQKPLQELFGAHSPVLTLACSGTGVMTAAVHCLFQPKEKVLIVEAGKFAERWREIANVRGLETTSLMVPFGQAVNPADVRAALDADPTLCGVLIQLSETSTGVQHPVEEVARITRQRDVLLVVDGISAVGISPCSLDEWGMDCLLTGSQKGLMVPAGLGL
ncbi:MAG: aminotransferase class V-fold PLP-dependent enzyme, partial [Desulfovibrionaceae bacterium]